MSSPLETRSLPGHAWEKFPESLKTFDELLRQKIIAAFDLEHHQTLRWIVESPLAIALSICLLFIILWFKRDKTSAQTIKSRFYFFIFFLSLLGLSDVIAFRLKIFFGRLKPHVDFYNPEFLPALSLPSSHAFNTAFVCFFLLKTLKLEGKRLFFGLLFTFTFFIGISRVALGQHYSLDVLVGWAGGGLFGILGANLWATVLSRIEAGKLLRNK